MPSGKTHDSITKKTAPLVAVSTFVASILIQPADINFIEAIFPTLIITASYIFAAFMFSGDLDLYSRQTRRWGIFKFIWKPYQSLFNHRSVFTHGILLGPVVRLIYLYMLCLPLWIAIYILKEKPLGLILDKTWLFISNPPTIFILFFIGIVLGGASHTLADLFVKDKKK